ncbi:mycofactocin-coupled SDR family oxidoreductase [Jatrophihabitans sp.]|uniref:mycofactocin-coupled SDR family oxidoreductase n=1 Tax=Jatrophihabitans sp. TaxID=1932789 RepID=UPI0030C6A73C
MDRHLEGKVALVTGAARGLGRSHAVRLAEAGADIIAIDICHDLSSVAYPLASPSDLEETARLVTALGQRIVTHQVDVRDLAAMCEAVTDSLTKLPTVDIVIVNAGISAMQADESPDAWDQVIGVHLSGAFNTVQAAAPTMIAQGTGGAIVLTGSVAGLGPGYGGTPCGLAYTAAKHGIVGLMRSYAASLGQHSIRVNAIHPTAVNTAMAQSEEVHGYTESIRQGSTRPVGTHALPFVIAQPNDISDAVMFLVSDAAKYITGVNLPVDAGFVL